MQTKLVLSTATKSGGVIITVTVGRVQGEPADDGTITLQIIPREVVTAADGTVLSDKFLGDWMTVQLDAATVAAINESIVREKAATDAALDAAAEAANPGA